MQHDQMDEMPELNCYSEGDRNKSRTIIVIPARLAATRLPNKLLLSETGKPLLQHTYESAQQATRASRVLVACDCEEIASTVRRFGGTAVLTSPTAASGTDRIAEAVAHLDEMDIIVNVQGDEPQIKGESIDKVIDMLIRSPDAVMATLATPIRDKTVLDDPACVKVVFDQQGKALYFSRSPIPFARNWSDDLLLAVPSLFYLHLGIYAYQRDFLLHLAKLPQSNLEKTENLEQLRVLSEGHTIMVGVVNETSIGIDTPEDYRRFVAWFNSEISK